MFNKTCLLAPGLFSLGSALTPVYLLECLDKNWILIEGGVLPNWNDVIVQASFIVSDLRKIKYWLITHAHYDHCGTIEQVYAHLPNVVIIASEKTKKFLHKDTYVELIRNLNIGLNEKILLNNSNFVPLTKIPIQAIQPGEKIILNGSEVFVIDSAGHCEDMVSYWFPSQKMLFCGDSLGDCFMGVKWRPLIFFDLKKYLNTIERLRQFSPVNILMGHQVFIEKAHSEYLFEDSYNATVNFFEEVSDHLRSGQSKTNLAKELSALIFPSVSAFISADMLYKSYELMIDILIKDLASGVLS